MKDFLMYFNNHFILFVLSMTLIAFLFLSTKITKKDKITLLEIVGAILALAIFEYIETIYEHYDYENFPRYLFSILCYILRPVIIVFFFHLRLNFNIKKRFLVWIPAVVNAAIYILAFFAYKNPSMRWVFWYDEHNFFDRTIVGYSAHAIAFGYLIALVIVSFLESKKHKSKRPVNYGIIFTVILAVLAQGLSMILNTNYSHTSDVYAIGATVYFIYLNYERNLKDTANYERKMLENTTALMLSQIQPHFIYNTLATIQVLCEIDPAQAAKTIESFSKYLRMNTDALSKKEPVPVVEEVRHAMAYADIEMIRFDNVKVLFAIKDKDFRLPVLTVEPILENAIKYGVRARAKGLVTVSTYCDNKNHYLVIKDNGIGFDINKIDTSGREHVGINNVKTRIETMVNGTFIIESAINSGTTVTVIVPKEV